MDWESFILGFFTNVLFWAILYFLIVPKIRYSDNISKILWGKNKNNKSGWAYRVKIENYGIRTIIDTEFLSKLEIKGLDSRNPNLWRIFNIPLDSYGQINYRYPEIKPVMENKKRPIIYICK